jgi:hypothetical protein
MRRHLFTVLSVGLASLLALSAGGLPASAQGPQPPTLDLVGQIAGPADAVAVQGNYAYVGAGPRLAIVNVSNPAQPAIVGQTEALGATIAAIAVTTDYAYVADGVAGLFIFSLADPTQPTQVGSFRTPAGHTEGVAVAGNYAYLANQFDGLRIVDVSDPAHPVEVGSYDILKDAVDVALAGSYAYVTDLRGGLRILDVSDPAHPVEVGVYHPPGFATGVAVVGQRAYVTASSTGLRVVDIADPTHPVEIGFYDTPGTSALDVAIAENLAFVADVETLRVIDVSTPTQPFEATFYDPPGFVVEVAVSGDLVYLAASDGGMLILRLQRPGPPPAGLVNGGFEGGFYLLKGQSIANGWAPYTLLGQPSFAGERSTRNSGQWAYKLSGYARFMAGLAQVISVQPGRTYHITVFYQLYPPGDGQAFLGVQDGTAPAQWVGDSQPGVWRALSQVITPTSDRLTISLQGNSGALPNTNVYFDDASVATMGQ